MVLFPNLSLAPTSALLISRSFDLRVLPISNAGAQYTTRAWYPHTRWFSNGSTSSFSRTYGQNEKARLIQYPPSVKATCHLLNQDRCCGIHRTLYLPSLVETRLSPLTKGKTVSAILKQIRRGNLIQGIFMLIWTNVMSLSQAWPSLHCVQKYNPSAKFQISWCGVRLYISISHEPRPVWKRRGL